MNSTYARFRKCALQVNPFNYSAAYQGTAQQLSEDEYNDQLATKCAENSIEVVGIADHGSVSKLPKLRAALEAKGVVVLPGFEICSSEKIHMVCLYPEGTSVDSLNQFLGALGLPPGAALTAASGHTCLGIAQQVQKQGGFWFAAHATGANGILRLNKDGGGLHHIWCDSALVLAAQIPAAANNLELAEQRIANNIEPAYKRDRPIALINAKDVKAPNDLDNPRTWSWFKMTVPSLDSLILACKDPESRVRFPEDINPTFYSRIERIQIDRGYLDGLDAHLSPSLNAVIGGRGTGKSSLIEALRFAFALEPLGKDAQRVHKSIVEGNFAKEKAGIKVEVSSFAQNGERYTISRYHGEPAKVLDEDGNLTDLTPDDLLPGIEVYGQNELLAIVQDESAKAELVARFLPANDTHAENLERSLAELAENREELLQTERKTVEIETRLLQLPALLEKQKAFQKLGLEAELKSIEGREAKRKYLADAATSISTMGSIVTAFERAIEKASAPSPLAPIKGAPEDPYASIHAEVDALKFRLSELALQAKSAATDAGVSVSGKSKLLLDEISKEELQFNKSIDSLPSLKGKSVAQLSAEYTKVAADIGKLEPLKEQLKSLKERRADLLNERAKALSRFSDSKNARWTALGKAVKALNKRLDGLLKIDFEPEGNRAPLVDFLLDCELDRVGEKRLGWVYDAETISVSELITSLRLGPEKLQERFKDAGLVRSVADAICSMPDQQIYQLEELLLPERVDLLLNVSQSEPKFKSVDRLSTGQQCTAVLHLLLLDNPDPLVVDQPEDNLDNSFIAGHIVTQLRDCKTKRQFLFATHNANIPVFGDAEWIGVMAEDDGHGRIDASGSIDRDELKTLAASILEGGKDAFTRRKEKYNF